ncbi:MAG TPA: FAD-binding oxidoreductase [Thermoanaerobaculia bacterium]|nr:FAD-binding oxidoreductase [Thermoanaerobaculia bacterium]
MEAHTSTQLAGLSARRLDGSATTLDQASLDALSGILEGDLLTPGASGYDESRSVWNAMIDRRPGAVVRSASAHDVAAAVRFAAEHDLLVSIKGAGHNIAGSAVADGALLIDLSGLRAVEVDPEVRTARVQPGATLGDFDAATLAHGLVTPLGINSTTGIAGLTLGGGFGWLTRKHGLTIDNLIGADVVTADGVQVRASADENPDLFWALRGGGGNFGVVTSFDFALHPIAPEIYAGLIVHPAGDGAAVLRRWRDFVADMPEELNVWAVMRKAPPLPFLPESVHGTEVVVLACFYAGPAAEAERLLEPLRSFGSPVGEHLGPMPYVAWQQAFDPLLAPGARNYWKSHNFRELGDDALDTVLDALDRLPTDLTEIFIGVLGGAANRVSADATAYPHRSAELVMNVHTRWESAADDERCVEWARNFFEQTAPFAEGGVYANFVSEGEQRLDAIYGPNYPRLAKAKAQYDPENRFRVNQNIEPAA